MNPKRLRVDHFGWLTSSFSIERLLDSIKKRNPDYLVRISCVILIIYFISKLARLAICLASADALSTEVSSPYPLKDNLEASTPEETRRS
jgi:hypothetical protein